MAIKTEFSIKDLENLSGVKAHTIRIWEKRYAMFTPDRTDTNIRKYNLEGLKKLLSVTQLYNEGHKISKIAVLSDTEINTLIKELSAVSIDAYLINQFKTAMFSFDYNLFDKTYGEMIAKYSFKQSFEEILIPLLTELGYLWQNGTIDPVHERYISELIRQKLTIEIDLSLQQFKKKSNTVIALYLPYHEIHELGLLYAQYLVINAGFPSIHLGSNIPLKSLKHVTRHHIDVIFMTYLTTQPVSLDEYLADFNNKVCDTEEYHLWCLGTKARQIDQDKVTENINVVTEINEFNNQLNQLIDA